jgi:hypothetical protein
MSDEFGFLTTTPGTQISWEVKRRDRPCLRCRLHLWLPPRRWGAWRAHWGCAKPVPLEHLKELKFDGG